MDGLSVSVDDVQQHVVTFGLDVYPPIEMSKERTRLSMFFEEVREKWPDVYEQLTVGETAFKISKRFSRSPEVSGPSISVDTFVLTARGPVFQYPLRLFDPIGDTGLEGTHRQIFDEVRQILWSAVPGHTILRVGLVRNILFSLGATDGAHLVSKQADWCRAKLLGGDRHMRYQDDKCNIGLRFSPGTVGKLTKLAIGTKVEQPIGYGLQLQLDVNNTNPRPLKETDIEEVIARADCFWPDEVLRYLTGV